MSLYSNYDLDLLELLLENFFFHYLFLVHLQFFVIYRKKRFDKMDECWIFLYDELDINILAYLILDDKIFV